ncbi:MAG TPA: hypothetical protein PKB02_17800 [Anaerohalosphaeraceae bacterium]|nr:hypothetical protein [Anaerohalosphaeraceae bacterium]
MNWSNINDLDIISGTYTPEFFYPIPFPVFLHPAPSPRTRPDSCTGDLRPPSVIDWLSSQWKIEIGKSPSSINNPKIIHPKFPPVPALISVGRGPACPPFACLHPFPAPKGRSKIAGRGNVREISIS